MPRPEKNWAKASAKVLTFSKPTKYFQENFKNIFLLDKSQAKIQGKHTLLYNI